MSLPKFEFNDQQFSILEDLSKIKSNQVLLNWHKDQKEVNKQILYSLLNSILKRGGILKWTVTDNNDMLYVTFIYPTYNVGVVDLELP